jgi:hypothetical protein
LRKAGCTGVAVDEVAGLHMGAGVGEKESALIEAEFGEEGVGTEDGRYPHFLHEGRYVLRFKGHPVESQPAFWRD